MVTRCNDIVVVTDCVGVPGTDGADGAPGPPGPPGGSWYFHTQAVASASWIIVHGLANWVHCTLMDSNHKTIYADVVRTDINTVTVNFAQPFSGFAYLS